MPRSTLTLSPCEFPFPALAAYAALAPLGREREIAMACLLAARLVAGTQPPLSFGVEVRRSRAQGARAWLAAHPMSGRLRAGFERLYDATADDPPTNLARPLRAVLEMTAARLDAGSREELGGLLSGIGNRESGIGSGDSGFGIRDSSGVAARDADGPRS